jgi:hypothetical protein
LDERKKINRWIFGTATAVVIPSLVTAWMLLAQSTFRHRADKFIEAEIKFKGTFLVDKKYSFDLSKSSIFLTFIGRKLKTKDLTELQRKKKYYGLNEVKLKIEQVAADEHIDAQLSKIVNKKLPSKLELEMNALQEEKLTVKNILIEAQTFVPQLSRLHLENEAAEFVWEIKPKSSEKKAMEDFIRLRIKRELSFSHAILI